MKQWIAVGLIVLSSVGALASSPSQSGAKDETKKAGQAAKEAGEDTADAAKHIGKATAKATTKAAKTVKRAVTGDVHVVCVDGTKQEGKTKADACAGHGGVKN